MSENKQNTGKSLSDFLRYRKGEMTGEERNSFERELQKDPFAEEASEGFETLSPSEILSDINIIKLHIPKARTHKREYIFYRIAASVALLMVISTIFILVEKNRSEEQYTKSEKVSEPFEISKGEPVIQNIAKNIQPSPVRKINKNVEESAPTGGAAEEIRQDNIVVKYLGTKKKDAIDSITDIKVKSTEIYLAEEKMAAPFAMAKAISSELTQVKGNVITSEDNMPVPGASIYVKGTTIGVVTDAAGNFSITLPDSEKKTLIANYIGMESKEFEAKTDGPLQVILDPSLSSLSEVIVVGYGIKRDEDLPSAYVAPQPKNGRPAFNKYIEENIIRPDTTTAGQRVVVVINFTVLSDGRIDSLKIIRSPGKVFSDEAIRLIKSGPQWKPAEDNGKVTEDEVRLRIVFK